MSDFDLLEKSALLPPTRLIEPGSWVGHIPFATWLVAQAKPRLLVELGTHTGNSYFAFCQSVLANELGTHCFAVDTWEGDEQAGLYGENVFASVRAHNDQHYAGFSTLLRMTFDDALSRFADGSIDLLHIDGLHTYAAVRHDFESWRPKLSSRAVVLFHDTSVRQEGFGVWRYWEELSSSYPHLHFPHANGLGVLFPGPELPACAQALLDAWADSAGRERLAGWFERLGNGVSFELLRSTADDLGQRLADQDKVIAGLHQAVAERDRRIEALSAEMAGLHQEVERRDHRIGLYDREVAVLKAERDAILNSASWRVTRPLRIARRLLEDGPRRLWRQAPFSFERKQRIKAFLFGRLPFLFFWSRTYRTWASENLDAHSSSSGQHEPYDLLYDPPQADPYVPLREGVPPAAVPVRLIALYLPQFHAIPENDAWWGEGFTEWTNVRPALPQFDGHYQPHVPGELGYYDLLDPAVQRRQVELARLYGVGGFCFYFYWFAGKRLLEQPVENYLNDSALDLPFCLCWANENWSRRWDGLDREILIAQQHTPEDDLAFIAHVSRYLRDERYIRINGRPLLIVYWPGQLPSARATAERWRQWCREHGVGEIYLAYTQSLEIGHPEKYGFDAAIEFPPNNMSPPEISRSVRPLSSDYTGRIFDWRYFVKRSRHYTRPTYPLFRACCPSWDNTARRKNRGTVFLNSSPRAYGEWLANAVKDTCERFASADERLIFVNAWNEWAEGAHLEPDQRYGYAWLEATRRALTGDAEPDERGRVVVVSHDAHPHGAQFLALGMVRSLIEELRLEVEVVLLGPGRLRGDFAALAPVHDLDGAGAGAASRLAADLVRRGFRRAILNTTVSAGLAPVFRAAGIEPICLVHELPGVIREFKLQDHAARAADSCSAVVFPSQVVADGFAQFAPVDPARQVIRPQGLYRRNRWRFDRQPAREELRRRLGLAADGKVVLTVGYADRRKGVDLFVATALTVLSRRSDVDFVWVGHWEPELQKEVAARLKSEAHAKRLHFVGYDPDTALYHAASDLYALTSREDPFPNVVLESFDVAVPVVAFAGTGGAAELLGRSGGLAVPALDTTAFADAICRLLDDGALATELGAGGREHVDQNLSFRGYLFDLCALLGLELPRVSVVVPNYNYADYIEARLDSIRRQTIPFYELILLDDASTDDSRQRMEQWLVKNRVEARLVANPRNAGNVFAQWRRGVELAGGDYVWIAEADDLSDPEFLATVLPAMHSGETVLSYCESRQIDAQGQILAANYHEYLKPLAPRTWQAAYTADGRDEIRSALAVLNTIPNVSAALFRREPLAGVFARHFAEIAGFSKAGDWVVYLRVLEQGRMAFSPRAGNRHRRHDGSVIGASSARILCREIAAVQALVARDYAPDLDVRRRAADYLASLHRQFGIENDMPEAPAGERT